MGRLLAAQIVGEASDSSWSQVAIFPSTIVGGAVEYDASGVVMMAVTLVAAAGESSNVDLGAAGRELLTRYQTQLTEPGTKTATDFYQTIKMLVAEQPLVHDLVVVRLVDDNLDVLGFGAGGVILKRGDKRGKIFSGVSYEWRGVQGHSLAGDRLLIGTSGLVGEMSTVLTDETLAFEDIAQAGEELTTQVHAAQENSGAAGLVIHIKEVETTQRVTETPEPLENPNIEQPGPPVYLKEPKRGRKTAISVGLILLVLLGMSVWFGWQRREAQVWDTKLNGIKTTTQQLLTQAQGLVTQDPGKAKQLTDQAIQGIKQADQEFAGQKKWAAQLQTYQSGIQTQINQILGEQQIGSLPVWYDLGLLREGMVGVKMALQGGNTILILDGSKGAVGSINITNKQAEIAGGGDLVKGATLVGVSGNRAVVWSPQGVAELNLTAKTSGVLVPPDSTWQHVVGLGLYGGNVYLLDAGSGDIFKYPGLAQGVGAKQRWLSVGVTPNLAKAVDMNIDGDMWVGLTDGTVKRFRRGAPEAFTMKGLSQPIGELAAVYTDDQIDHVYLLDRGNKRVVSFDKTGQYLKQYQWDGIAGVTDMVVAEKANSIYLLSGSSVYAMPL